MKLMQDQQDLMSKMSDVSNDITAAEEDILRSTDNSLDQVSFDKDCESPSPKKERLLPQMQATCHMRSTWLHQQHQSLLPLEEVALGM